MNFSRKEFHVRISYELPLMIIILPPVANLIIPLAAPKANWVPAILDDNEKQREWKMRISQMAANGGGKRSSNYSIAIESNQLLSQKQSCRSSRDLLWSPFRDSCDRRR